MIPQETGSLGQLISDLRSALSRFRLEYLMIDGIDQDCLDSETSIGKWLISLSLDRSRANDAILVRIAPKQRTDLGQIKISMFLEESFTDSTEILIVDSCPLTGVTDEFGQMIWTARLMLLESGAYQFTADKSEQPFTPKRCAAKTIRLAGYVPYDPIEHAPAISLN